MCGENIENQAQLLSKLEEKQKTLFESLFLIFLVIIIVNLFNDLNLLCVFRGWKAKHLLGRDWLCDYYVCKDLM